MKRRTAVLALAFSFGLLITACDATAPTTSTEAIPAETQAAANQGPAASQKPIKQTGSLFAVDLDPDDDITYPEEENPAGMMALRRNPKSGVLSWQIKSSAFNPGHAFTVWIGNFDDPALTNGGWGAGGLVGANGQFTVSGNHCIWPLVTFTDGGFEPGTKPDCSKIDGEGPITVFVLDHRDWNPGDILERWDPNGARPDDDTATELAGFLVASFDPVN